MSTIRPAVPQEEAEQIAETYVLYARELYQKHLFSHPMILGLQAGTTPHEQIKGFLKDWYTFSKEVNTAASTVYHRYFSWFKTHPRLAKMMTRIIAEELNEPGPVRAGEAVGLTLDDMVHARLIPEARAWVDFQGRLLVEGTLAEAAADFICEGEFGHFAKLLFDVLTTRYGFTPRSAEYFKEHYEADAVGYDDLPSHGDRGKLLLQALLAEGMVEERTGWGVEYTIEITVLMFKLLLDGVVRQYPASESLMEMATE